MLARFTQKATTDYAKAPQEVRKAFQKQLGLLMQNLQHPSLHAKNTVKRRMSGRQESIGTGASTSPFRGTYV